MHTEGPKSAIQMVEALGLDDEMSDRIRRILEALPPDVVAEIRAAALAMLATRPTDARELHGALLRPRNQPVGVSVARSWQAGEPRSLLKAIDAAINREVSVSPTSRTRVTTSNGPTTLYGATTVELPSPCARWGFQLPRSGRLTRWSTSSSMSPRSSPGCEVSVLILAREVGSIGGRLAGRYRAPLRVAG